MCFQPYNRLCHWGPFTALGIIKIVTGMTIHCSSMWWPPHLSIGGFLNSATFMVLSGLTLYNFLSSVFHGPGYLPLKWKPVKEDDTIHLQWCTICEGYKAPRSHHCRKCGRCVLKMDHHCPWVNACVGWGNHGHFTAFLLSAVLGCSHAAFILACSLYRALNRVWYQYYGTGNEPIVYLNVYTMVLTVFALGLAVGVVLAVGMLLFFQVRAIVRNRTGVEDWIVEKANFRRQGTVEEFQFPYDLGLWRNIRQVVNFSCYPVGNGINWEVKEGCDEFSLTREQIAQKNEKRQRTKTYTVISPVSGSWFPLFSQGLFVCLHPPCTDEPRIRLEVGDTVNVTRWRKYWFFGEKVQPVQIDNKAGEGTSKLPKIRGWFPRRCVVELTNTTDSAKKLN